MEEKSYDNEIYEYIKRKAMIRHLPRVSRDKRGRRIT